MSTLPFDSKCHRFLFLLSSWYQWFPSNQEYLDVNCLALILSRELQYFFSCSQLIFLGILYSEKHKPPEYHWEEISARKSYARQTVFSMSTNAMTDRQFLESSSKHEPLVSLHPTITPGLLNATSNISWTIIISPVTGLPLPPLLVMTQQSLRWPSCFHFWPTKINSPHSSSQSKTKINK